MKQMVAIAAVFVLISVFSASAAASSRIDRPDVKVGDSWSYAVRDQQSNSRRSELHVVVSIVTNESITVKETFGTDAVLVVFGRDWDLRQRGNQMYGAPAERLRFPLEVGKSWKYQLPMHPPQCGPIVTEYQAQAVQWEEVSVPAGTYRAMRVEHHGVTSKPCEGRITVRLWYVPEIKNFAKYETFKFAAIDGRVLEAVITELTRTSVRTAAGGFK